MAKNVSKEDAEELWTQVRKVLVEDNIITPNGVGTNDKNDALQKELRRLILVKSLKK